LAVSTAIRVSRLCDVQRMRLWLVMTVVVLAIWLGGAAVTKFTLEQMAFVTPLAVVVVGVTVGIVLLWVKIVRDSMRRRRE
jgi:undecaprenyl pyrophosphate phosphatase UppP